MTGRGAQARRRAPPPRRPSRTGRSGEHDVEHLLRHLPGGLERRHATPGSPWWPMPDLHVAGLDREVGVADGRDGARGEADAHAAGVVDGLLGGRDDLVEAAAHGGLRAADLPHQDLAGDAAALLALVRRRRRHVVVGDDGLRRGCRRLRPSAGHLDVHVVAGVVAVQAGDARRRRRPPGRRRRTPGRRAR